VKAGVGVGLVISMLVACGAGPGDGDGVADGVTVTTPFAPEAILAYQDGEQPWTVIASDGGSAVIPMPADRYRVAILCPIPPFRAVDVYELTVAEATVLAHVGECRSRAVTVSGSVTSVEGSLAFVRFGERSIGVGEAVYSLTVPTGTGDLVALRQLQTQLPHTTSERAVIMRGLEVTGDITVPLDLSDTSGIALEQHVVTGVYGSNTGAAFVDAKLATAGGTVALLSQSVVSTSGAPVHINTIPASALGDDLHLITAEVGQRATLSHLTSQTHATRTVTSLDFDFDTFGGDRPVPQYLPDPYLRVRVPWSGVGSPVYELVAEQLTSSGTGAITWTIKTSAGYAGAGSVITLEMPELSPITGWSGELEILQGFGRVLWHVAELRGASFEQLMQLRPTQELTIDKSGWYGAD
jgi:hypothetical protein